jgi:transposase
MESQLRVGIDVGCHAHRVGIAGPDGSILEEFDISHSEAGFQEFFRRVENRRGTQDLPVAVAMEGYNGYARPLDRLVQEKGYRLFNVNNLKLSRFKEVFPGAAKTDPIDARKILELFHLREQLPIAKCEAIGSGLAITHRVVGSRHAGSSKPSTDRRVVHAQMIGDLLLGVALLAVGNGDASGVLRIRDDG